MNLLFKQGGVIFYTDPLAADDSKPDSDNIRIMIMTKVAPHWILIMTKVAPHRIIDHDKGFQSKKHI